MTSAQRPVAGPFRIVSEYLLIVTGTFLNAVSINMFLLPNDVVAGGVTGLALIVDLSLGVPFAVALLALNLPLLALQWFRLGSLGTFLRTVTGLVSLAFFTQLLGPHVPEVTQDRLLAICYTGRKKTLVYAVVPRSDIQRLKLRVLDRDPEAFITVLTPRESIGGFRLASPD